MDPAKSPSEIDNSYGKCKNKKLRTRRMSKSVSLCLVREEGERRDITDPANSLQS